MARNVVTFEMFMQLCMLMKRKIGLFLILCFIPVICNAMTVKKDKDISGLWQKYEKAKTEDSPKSRMKILTDIKEAAKTRRLTYDFYRAVVLYEEVGGSVDWKQRDKLREQRNKEIADYDEPVLTFLNMRRNYGIEVGDLVELLTKEAGRLKSAQNRVVWEKESCQNMFGEVLTATFLCDYDFVVWETFIELNRYRYLDEIQGMRFIKDELEKITAGKYPQEAFYEYMSIKLPECEEKAAMEKFAEKYAGKAVALFAEQSLLLSEFHAMDEDTATSDQYKSFYRKLEAFEAHRASFKGQEAEIAGKCTEVANLMAGMKHQTASMSIHEGKVTLTLRNLSDCDFVLYGGKKGGKVVFSHKVNEDESSFYAFDKVQFDLPVLADGYYYAELKTGKTVHTAMKFPKFTLSLAFRNGSIYVADYKSGKPIGKVDLNLMSGGETVETIKDFAIDGFTVLPKEWQRKLSSNRNWQLYAACNDGMERRSQEISYFPAISYPSANHESVRAVVMKDCAAFNPGQTVRFKTIAFTEYSDGKMRTMPAGTALKAVLYSPDNKVLQSLSLKTNEFGSAHGRFELENLEKHGRHNIVIVDDCGRHLASTELIVDEYVLPSFTLAFDTDNRLYLPGDEVQVSGVLKSYSGHSLSGANVSYVVSVGGEKSEERPLEAAADGKFQLAYMANDGRGSDWLHCSVKIKVVDATGETWEFEDWKTVSSYLRVDAEVENAVDAQIDLADGFYGATSLVEKNAKVRMLTRDGSGTVVPLDVKYTLLKGERELRSGTAKSGETVEFVLGNQEDGLYTLKLYAATNDVAGREVKTENTLNIVKIAQNSTTADVDFDSYFRALDGISVQFSAGKEQAWVVAELFDDRAQSLKKEMIYIPASKDGKAVVRTLSYGYDPAYPDAVVLKLFYFRDGRSEQFSHVVRRSLPDSELSLIINRFTDNCMPGSRYVISFNSAADAEFLAAIFDKSTETIAANRWYEVVRWQRPVAEPYETVACGVYGRIMYDYFYRKNAKAYGANAPMDMVMEETAMDAVPSMGAMEMDIVEDVAEVEEMMTVDEQVDVRSDFATAIAFEPHLTAAGNGEFGFDFTASDKLSAFICALYGHDRDMHTVTTRRELVVSLPVKVSVVQPQFLYEGDRYVLNASVSNAGKDVKGVVSVYLYNGTRWENATPVRVIRQELEIAAGATGKVAFPVDVPAGLEALGFKVVFSAKIDDADMNDAVFVSVPVLPARQMLTESHSAVLLSGMDSELVMANLRKDFVNTSAEGAVFSEASLWDMLKAELKLMEAPEYENAMSLVDALYCNILGGSLAQDAAEYKAAAAEMSALLADYVNHDGGMAWMKGMKSSVIMSAVVAERIAFLRERGLAGDDLLQIARNAVKFIDRQQFDYADLPYWCGYLSPEQYVYLRSLWTDVPFDGKVISTKVQKEHFTKFRKNVESYLTGKDSTAINGNILYKSRRAAILLSLLRDGDGRRLAKEWGIRFGTESKLLTALAADVRSLEEYAVQHPSGGWYYPNLVMPYRGLLSSEAYCHASVCNLYRSLLNVQDSGLAEKLTHAIGTDKMESIAAIADGIRIWIMIQKESQEWRNEPGYYDAIAAVCDGSEEVKDVRVMALSKQFEKPFSEIKAAGNGFSVGVKYYLNEVKAGNEILDGQVLNVGDKVVAQYNVWNAENRSFVKLHIPRPAAFRPEEQVSGWPHWTFRRLGCGMFYFTPVAYREVRAQYTDYWFDVLPEEETVYTENFYVTQEGSFTAPVATVESLYAPHYRANDTSRGCLIVR